jgi:pentatricopeptide repeat protein
MLREASLEPTPTQYYLLIRALLQGGDLVSGTEALQEMERAGASCFVNPPRAAAGDKTAVLVGPALKRELPAFDHRTYLSVKAMLVTSICAVDELGSFEPSKQQLDALYFGLVEQVRAAERDGSTPVPVPRVVLDALIHSAGKAGQLDRAFRIFQEATTIFKVEPDLTTYNALLAACSARVVVPMATVFQVFQDIEATFLTQPEWKGTEAAEYTFSILLEAMYARKEYRLLTKVRRV